MKTASDIRQLETKKILHPRTHKTLFHNHTHIQLHKNNMHILQKSVSVPIKAPTQNVHRMIHIVCERTLLICQWLFHGLAEDWTSDVQFTRRPEGCRCGWPALASCLPGFYPSRCRRPSSPFLPPAARLPDRIGTPDPSAGRPASVSHQPAGREMKII